MSHDVKQDSTIQQTNDDAAMPGRWSLNNWSCKFCQQQEDSMKVRFTVESIPKPKTTEQYIIALIVERIDIICRVIVKRYRK